MLIHAPTTEPGSLTLLLTRAEAEDLIKKLAYLIDHPEYHHDHLEDYANECDLSMVILDQVDRSTLVQELQDLLETLVEPKP